MTDFFVTIEGPRGQEWNRVAGTRRFPVRSPIPIRANLPGKPNALVYLLDLGEIDPEVLAKIAAYLGLKFDMSDAETAAEMTKVGIPILAEDCSVTVLHPQRWF